MSNWDADDPPDAQKKELPIRNRRRPLLVTTLDSIKEKSDDSESESNQIQKEQSILNNQNGSSLHLVQNSGFSDQNLVFSNNKNF